MPIHVSTWQTPSSFPQLDGESIHLWLADIRTLAQCGDVFEPLLDADERARANAFHAPHDRLRAQVSRGVLRLLAAHYVASAPRSIRFTQGEFGKPALDTPNAALTFNLSHSGDFVLLAFAREGELGVDVEQWNPRLGEDERTRLARSVFSAAERAALEQVPSAAERERAFYALWSRKEAYLKGTGAGIVGGLSDVEFAIGDVARLVADRRDALAVSRWIVRDIDVGAGYSAALASSSPARSLVTFVTAPDLFTASPV